MSNKEYPVKTIPPFLKWAGGKRWLLAKHPELFSISPKEKYIEPFLGSGAVFFYISPQNSILSDLNKNLIETYKAIKNDWASVLKELNVHQENHSKEYYYIIRDEISKKPAKRAAQLIYLNRTCWNGLYRVNKNGKFNVPIGTKLKVILDTDNFEAISLKLKNTTLVCSDFEETINNCSKNDLLFVDPPYTVCHNKNGFLKYNETMFSWNDQVRLRDTLFRAKKRGARVIITNANHESIQQLYNGFGNLKATERPSVLSGDSRHRKMVDELIITSWN